MKLTKKAFDVLTPKQITDLRNELARRKWIRGYFELAVFTGMNPNTLRLYKWRHSDFPKPDQGMSVRQNVWDRKRVESWMKNRGYQYQQQDHAEANT